MGVGTDSYGNGQRDEGQGWLSAGELSQTAVTQPAGSVLMTEKHGDDVHKWDVQFNNDNFNDEGNFSSFAMAGIICGDECDGKGWGPQLIPNGTRTPVTAAYEYGPNGAVSASYQNQSVFVFCDGHAKSMVPSASDPDPINQPQNNLWNALR